MNARMVQARRATAARMAGAAVVAAVVLAGAGASAQLAAPGAIQPFSPFDVVGILQEATFGDCPGACGGADALAGGTLTVNGQLVIVPRNTVVLLPATAMTWKELFDHAPAPYLGLGQTGLALGDGNGTTVPPPFGGYEVHVEGNRVNGVNVAGLVSISQHSLMTGQGFVSFIDYVTGELRVGGIIGDPNCQQGVVNPACSGQRVKLNDPIGRFGRAWSPDARFTIDEENPTVRAATGFPMCVPRTDPGAGAGDALCPQTNRPLDPQGRPQTIFTMPAPGPGVKPDAGLMAPFQVGDYVTYSGILARDGAAPTAGLPVLPWNVLPPLGVLASPAVSPLVAPLTNVGTAAAPATLVAAYSMVANASIFTFAGTNPAYVALDVTLLGVGGIAIPGFPQEASTRTRFEGFSTDPTRTISIWGVDVDPCTGVTSDRNWGSSLVDPGPPTGAVLGRWRFRPPSNVLTMPTAGVFLPATREVRASITGYAYGAVTPGGLVAGQYHAPISSYIFPEPLQPGNPPIALTFNEFPFLMNGSGPWPGAGGAIVGRLTPTPWDPALNAAPTGCAAPVTIPVPTASAGLPQTVNAGTLVTLDATASSSNTSPPQPLAFQWTQTGPAGGPFAILSNPTVAQPTFTAPIVTAPTALTFQVTVSDLGGTSTAAVTITVNPVASAQPPVASLTAPASVVSGATVTLDATASVDGNVPPTALTYAFTQVSPTTPALVITPAGATASFKAPVVTVATTFTFTATVTNGLGLSATSAPVAVTVGPASPPIVQAVPNQSILSGNPPSGVVTLTGAATDPNGLPLTYTWSQLSGPTAVVLTPGGPSASPTATFAAPTLPAGSGPITYGFQLAVTNGVTAPVVVTMTVTVRAPDVVTITSVVYRTGAQRLTVTATSSAPANSGVTMSLHIGTPAPAGTTVQMTSLGGTPLTFTATLTGTPNPDPTGGVTVTSSLGGTATSLVTRLR
ncbi:MAG TPA: hypothetical protein VFP50_20670 [Anaeromyxobacteraceae bacterium]|nr:hypothetical protein [Anaeromyxobacteraceae bacterium]